MCCPMIASITRLRYQRLEEERVRTLRTLTDAVRAMEAGGMRELNCPGFLVFVAKAED